MCWSDSDAADTHAQVRTLLIVMTVRLIRRVRRSGLGPAGHLQSLGISVKKDLPGVGSDLVCLEIASTCAND